MQVTMPTPRPYHPRSSTTNDKTAKVREVWGSVNDAILCDSLSCAFYLESLRFALAFPIRPTARQRCDCGAINVTDISEMSFRGANM